jgi:hypothetical protein
MNFQIVARFLATTVRNHECDPMIKSLSYPKNEELPENSQVTVKIGNFYPVSNISSCLSAAGHDMRH